jgi:hypothetical protein
MSRKFQQEYIVTDIIVLGLFFRSAQAWSIDGHQVQMISMIPVLYVTSHR